MTARISIRLGLVVLLVLSASTALARPDSARLGLGAESMLGFWSPGTDSHSYDESTVTPGFSVIYPASEIFDLQGILGTRLAVGSGPDPALSLILGVRGIYRGLPLANNVDLGVFFGGGYEIEEVMDFIGGTDRNHNIHLETGIRPEWFIRDWLSIHSQVGLSIGLLLGQGGYDPGVSMAFFGVPTLLGKAGFTLWF